MLINRLQLSLSLSLMAWLRRTLLRSHPNTAHKNQNNALRLSFFQQNWKDMRPVTVATYRYLGRDRLIQARVHALVCKHTCLLIGRSSRG